MTNILEGKAATVIPGQYKVVCSIAGGNRGMSLGQLLRSRLGKEKIRAEGYFNRRKGRA
jgi:hypothetical protein